jgi:Rieske 2Fe-2S family protein
MPAGFDLSGYALQQLQVRELDGLIFFSFAEDPPDFDEFAARMAPRLAHHALPDAKLAAVRTYSIRANWKLVVENSRECYHCGTGHPQYCRAVGFAAAVDSREAIAETRRVREDILPELVRRGVETEEIPFTADTWYHALHFLLRPGMLTESMDGRPVAPLMGSFCDWSAGCMAIVAMPSFMLEASCDHVFTLRFLPDGPDATSAEACWFVAPNAREGADYEIAKLTEFWHLTCVQDWKLCEENQAGVNSLHYRPGPYAPDESGAAAFAEWYLRRLAPASAARESTL